MDTCADVTAVLDPVLTPLGFSRGQAGEDSPDSQIIWCAAFSDFALAFPWLPQAELDVEPTGQECVDLVADLAAGHLVRLDLEGRTISETLRLIGRPGDADEIRLILGKPAAAAGADLVPVLRRLFDRVNSEGAEGEQS